jgi:hypothetical protein
MRRILFTMAFVLVAVTLLLASSVVADTAELVSDQFSLGFGATKSWSYNPTWTTEETAGQNTPTVDSKGFSFMPAPVGNGGDSQAVAFTGRVLTESVGDINYNGSLNDGTFSVPITASYTGAAPANVNAGNPGYRLMLEITNVSIYANANIFEPGATATELGARWWETTSGHEAAAAGYTVLNKGWSYYLSSYKQIAWDPDDYTVPLSNLNDSSTRTFSLRNYYGDFLPSATGDGLEVMGKVHLLYNAVPEPTALTLLITGMVGLVACAWRKRR